MPHPVGCGVVDGSSDYLEPRLQCHGSGSRHVRSDTACTTCHQTLAEATPPPVARSRSYEARIARARICVSKGHGELVAQGARSCAVCHARDFCAQCHVNAPEVRDIQHSRRIRLPRSRPNRAPDCMCQHGFANTAHRPTRRAVPSVARKAARLPSPRLTVVSSLPAGPAEGSEPRSSEEADPTPPILSIDTARPPARRRLPVAAATRGECRAPSPGDGGRELPCGRVPDPTPGLGVQSADGLRGMPQPGCLLRHVPQTGWSGVVGEAPGRLPRCQWFLRPQSRNRGAAEHRELRHLPRGAGLPGLSLGPERPPVQPPRARVRRRASAAPQPETCAARHGWNIPGAATKK
jgi:hypothetical protein